MSYIKKIHFVYIILFLILVVLTLYWGVAYLGFGYKLVNESDKITEVKGNEHAIVITSKIFAGVGGLLLGFACKMVGIAFLAVSIIFGIINHKSARNYKKYKETADIFLLKKDIVRKVIAISCIVALCAYYIFDSIFDDRILAISVGLIFAVFDGLGIAALVKLKKIENVNNESNNNYYT